jgi:hypothetical protein
MIIDFKGAHYPKAMPPSHAAAVSLRTGIALSGSCAHLHSIFPPTETDLPS